MLAAGGPLEPPGHAVLVLAQATLSAAGEAGRRGGAGDCVELLQQHDGGLIYLRSLPQGRVLFVRCENTTDIPSLSHQAAQMEYAQHAEAAPQAPTPEAVPLNLSDAFLAEPRW